MARKGRARRFREARELKQGFDDGLFRDSGGSLADVADAEGVGATDADGDDEDRADPWDDAAEDRAGWDDEDPLRADERGSAAG